MDFETFHQNSYHCIVTWNKITVIRTAHSDRPLPCRIYVFVILELFLRPPVFKDYGLHFGPTYFIASSVLSYEFVALCEVKGSIAKRFTEYQEWLVKWAIHWECFKVD